MTRPAYPSNAWMYLLPIAFACGIASVLELIGAQWFAGAAAGFAAVALGVRSVVILVKNRQATDGDMGAAGTPS